MPRPAAGITAFVTRFAVISAPYGKDGTIFPVTDKSEIRKEYRAYRRTKPAGDNRAAQQLLDAPEIATAKTITAYWAIDHEPATQGIFAPLVERGVRLLLPIVNGDWSLDWGPWEGTDSLIERRGLWEPRESLGPSAIAQADVVIAPGLRVDRRGVRLGQGAGCYDRTLALASPEAWVVVLLHDGELSDSDLPEEAHDRRVDAVVTPSEFIRFGSRHT